MRGSVDHALRSDRHVRFERRFPSRTFDGATGGALGDPSPWHTGDSYVPDLVGWVLSLLVTPGSTALVHGHLHLRTAWKEPAEYEVSGFAVGAGGRVFVPWPAVELELRDANVANANESTAVVSFSPVFRSDPRPPGIGTVLYGRTREELVGGALTVAVPAGATEYRFMPSGNAAAFTEIREEGSGIEYARYSVGAVATSILAPGTESGDAAWRQVPPPPNARIGLSGTLTDAFTLFWRYDLGTVR